jgi:pantothenate kinase-related protein Tda10
MSDDITKDDANQIVFSNGLRAIKVDAEAKDVTVLLLEGWVLHVIPVDSGLGVDVETKKLAHKDFPGVAKVTTRRMAPKPELVAGEGMTPTQLRQESRKP